MSTSEIVVAESNELRELLRFLYYLDILNELLLLLRKHSKYMHAKCLNFPCFFLKCGWMYAYILHVYLHIQLVHITCLSLVKVVCHL